MNDLSNSELTLEQQQQQQLVDDLTKQLSDITMAGLNKDNQRYFKLKAIASQRKRYNAEYWIKNKEKLSDKRRKAYKDKPKKQLTKEEREDIQFTKQLYYYKNREKILMREADKRREKKEAGIVEKVVCWACNKELLKSNIARHVSTQHEWIIDYKKGY